MTKEERTAHANDISNQYVSRISPDKTDVAPFWSCMGPEDIVAMFNEAARRMGMRCRWSCEKYYVDIEDSTHRERKLSEDELKQIKQSYNSKQEDIHKND